MAKFAWLAALGLQALPPASAGTLRERWLERMAAGRGDEPAGEGGGAVGSAAFPLPPGASVERNVAYGEDPAQTLDVYRPAHAEGAPVIFMVHGGGWRLGDKGMSRSVKNKVTHWVGKGYVLVSMNYRMLPEARPIEQAHDVAEALAFSQGKAKTWGADPARFVLVGHSSGAHLASLLTADPELASRAGAKPWLGTVSLDSAAFDVVSIMRAQHFGLYDKAFGKDPGYWHDASPLHLLNGKLAAPMIAVCSSRRSDSCTQAQAFAAKASSLGGRVVVLPVDLSHGDVNDQLGIAGPYTAGVESFMRTLGLP